MPHTDETRGLVAEALRLVPAFFANIPAVAAATAAGAWTAVPGAIAVLSQRGTGFAGGAFVAPEAGWYTFSFNVFASIITASELYVLLSVNGAPGGGGTSYGTSYLNNVTGTTVKKQMVCTVTIPMARGDSARLYYFSTAGGNSLNDQAGSFSGAGQRE